MDIQITIAILYKQGLSDAEIARKLNINSYAVVSWRKSNNLNANRRPAKGVSMQNALNAQQCKDMEYFLACLFNYSNQCHEQGVKPDASKFLETFRELDMLGYIKYQKSACI